MVGEGKNVKSHFERFIKICLSLGMAAILVLGGCSSSDEKKKNEELAQNEIQKRLANKQSIEDLMKRINTSKPPMMSLQDQERLYQDIMKRRRPDGTFAPPTSGSAASAVANSAAPAPAKSEGTTLASNDEFTALIRQSGYQPHPHDPGLLPYFDTDPGIPAKNIRIFYLLSGDNQTLILAAKVRNLRNDELPDLDVANMDKKPVYVPELIKKLQAANPLANGTTFIAVALPDGMQGQFVMNTPMILVQTGFSNDHVDKKIVEAAVNFLAVAMDQTREIWQ